MEFSGWHIKVQWWGRASQSAVNGLVLLPMQANSQHNLPASSIGTTAARVMGKKKGQYETRLAKGHPAHHHNYDIIIIMIS